jgi:hypothetical protein
MSTHRLGNSLLVSRIEEHGHELEGRAPGVVDGVGDDGPFPVDALAFPWLLVPAEAAIVGRGADQQDELGQVESVEHPARPLLRRGAVDVLVEVGVDAVRTQSLREGKDPLAVRLGVVAVADEHPRRGRS